MLAVEHAPHGERGKYGAYPQIGVPAGMLLASIMLYVLTAVMSKESFDGWGWRIAFVFSIVLLFVGQYIRRRVGESPVFRELQEAKQNAKSPMLEVLRNNFGGILLAACMFIGINSLGYMLTGGFTLSYATSTHKFDRNSVLIWVLIAAALWIVTTMAAAIWSDRIGRRKVFIYGYGLMILMIFPLFFLVANQNLATVALSLLLMTIPLGLTYGPLSALYAENFPPRLRLSGASLAYALGAVLGGAFSPMIAQALTQATGTVMSVA